MTKLDTLAHKVYKVVHQCTDLFVDNYEIYPEYVIYTRNLAYYNYCIWPLRKNKTTN